MANTDIQLCHSESNFKGNMDWSQIACNLHGKIIKGRLRQNQEESTQSGSDYIYIYIFLLLFQYLYPLKVVNTTFEWKAQEKSDNADIILKRKELQYKSEQLVTHVQIPPGSISSSQGNRNISDTTKRGGGKGGLKTRNPIRQTSLLLLFMTDKGHVSSPGLAEGYKATAVLSCFPADGALLIGRATQHSTGPLASDLQYQDRWPTNIWSQRFLLFFLRLFVQYITKWAYICDYALIRWSTECKINLTSKWCRVFKYSTEISGLQHLKVQVRSQFRISLFPFLTFTW